MLNERTTWIRRGVFGVVSAAIVSAPLACVSCDRTEEHTKKTTTTLKETPTDKTKTTETTERKVETQPK